jgi:diketogulonate reductase-like aldo/keto reductase
MEGIQRSGRLRLIGVSNITAEQLELLCDFAEVRPTFVQNRCFARQRWDCEVREVCRREGVVYQGFSLLTANTAELQSREIREIAHRHQTSVTSVVFSFALRLGMMCLTGTTDPRHMREDLAASSLKLSDEEIAIIEHLSG